MVTKNIAITEEAYNALKRLKKENQSFSQIVIEVTNEKKGSQLDKFFGILNKSRKETDEMQKK